MKIWLDDIREAPNGYNRTLSVNETKQLILDCENSDITIDELHLDHDLGDYARDGGDAIELVKWLAETERYYEIKIHSMNIDGKQNMQALINRYWT
jgi:hypothetical protein